MDEKDRLDQITRGIIGEAIEVHRTLGPGLLGLDSWSRLTKLALHLSYANLDSRLSSKSHFQSFIKR